MAKPRKRSTKPTKKTPTPPQNKKPKETKRFNIPIDEGDKARFHHHLPKIVSLRDAVATATSNLRNGYKGAKADGFTKADFDYAIDVSTPEKEATSKEAIRRRLLIAKFVGSDLGSQLDLFSEPTRVPAVDRAYEEGQTASMQNKAAKPDYDPSTEQFAKYMKGFHDHQAKIAKGIAKKTADKYIGRISKKAQAQAQNGGFGMSEEEFAAEQAAAAPALAEHGLDEGDTAL